MTAEQLKELGIPFEDTGPETCLTVESGLEWLKENTRLEFDPANLEEVKALPARARLFLLRFAEVSSLASGVTSESIGGLSQSFDTGGRDGLLWKQAEELIGDLLKSRVKFIPAKRGW